MRATPARGTPRPSKPSHIPKHFSNPFIAAQGPSAAALSDNFSKPPYRILPIAVNFSTALSPAKLTVLNESHVHDRLLAEHAYNDDARPFPRMGHRLPDGRLHAV